MGWDPEKTGSQFVDNIALNSSALPCGGDGGGCIGKAISQKNASAGHAAIFFLFFVSCCSCVCAQARRHCHHSLSPNPRLLCSQFLPKPASFFLFPPDRALDSLLPPPPRSPLPSVVSVKTFLRREVTYKRGEERTKNRESTNERNGAMRCAFAQLERVNDLVQAPRHGLNQSHSTQHPILSFFFFFFFFHPSEGSCALLSSCWGAAAKDHVPVGFVVAKKNWPPFLPFFGWL